MSNIVNKLRSSILTSATKAKEGHIASAFSILDILWVLYDSILKNDPSQPNWDQRDRFVLSKGHGSLGLYAVLSEKGYFDPSIMDTFASKNSILGGHPDSNKVPGVEASTGSLGHGFPMAVGMALGMKIKLNKKRVFVIIGDGECNEGTIWEGALLASHHKLGNLCCIIDHNHSGDRALDLGNLKAKFTAFGWNCSEMAGHDHAEIANTLSSLEENRPNLVVAHTIKGKGCPEMESNPSWHHRAPTANELPSLLNSLA